MDSLVFNVNFTIRLLNLLQGPYNSVNSIHTPYTPAVLCLNYTYILNHPDIIITIISSRYLCESTLQYGSVANSFSLIFFVRQCLSSSSLKSLLVVTYS